MPRSSIILLLAGILSHSSLFAKDLPKEYTLHPAISQWAPHGPTATLLNVNAFRLWVDRSGYFPLKYSTTGFAAGEYPRGFPVIYAEGILWGAKVDDGGERRIRVNGSTTRSGMKAGKVFYDASGNMIGSEDPETRHIWRVRRDYESVDLTEDAASFFNLETGDVTSGHLDTIYHQYEYDWNNWPAEEGAPFEDVDGGGSYDPLIDIPGEPGADQTIWLVANDLPFSDGSYPSDIMYASPPIGIEMQMSLWACQLDMDQPLGNAVFKRIRLVYTGLPETPDTAHMDTMYMAQWSDPDVGDYTDDFVGWDRFYGMGYAYNGRPSDEMYTEAGLGTPSVGYVLFQGSTSDGRSLQPAAFYYWVYWEPSDYMYIGTLEMFNAMEGYLFRPAYPKQRPIIDPLTEEPTRFMLSGDPVTGTGWVDGIQLPPHDRRMMASYGPFAMTRGDTLDAVIATIGALAENNLASLRLLRLRIKEVWLVYLSGLAVPTVATKMVTPSRFDLGQNYPNPFNIDTQILYDVAWEAPIRLAVYDLLGRAVITLVERRPHAPGSYSVTWNGTDRFGLEAPSGIYLCRMEVLSPPALPGRGTIRTVKMVLLR